MLAKAYSQGMPASKLLVSNKHSRWKHVNTSYSHTTNEYLPHVVAVVN